MFREDSLVSRHNQSRLCFCARLSLSLYLTVQDRMRLNKSSQTGLSLLCSTFTIFVPNLSGECAGRNYDFNNKQDEVMLKKILSISGKPGLYKLVSQSRNMIIVESLIDGKRMPTYARDKVVTLSDIAMYTETKEVPLREVLESIKKMENGAKASVDPKAEPNVLREYLAKVLPDFDRDRVYPTDIKKLVSWYNLLVTSGNDDFSEETKTQEEEAKA